MLNGYVPRIMYLPSWPNPSNFVLPPPLNLMRKYSAPPFYEPEPLPAELVEKHRIYLESLSKAFAAKVAAEAGSENKVKELVEAEEALKTVNKWSQKAVTNAQALVTRLSAELVTLQEAKAAAEEAVAEIQKKGSILNELVSMHSSRVQEYKKHKILVEEMCPLANLLYSVN